MCVVGYIDADDVDGLYGMNYFVVRNSFGSRSAIQNPIALPGHALIPENYVKDKRPLWEALLCLAEPSPAGSRGRHISTFLSSSIPFLVPQSCAIRW